MTGIKMTSARRSQLLEQLLKQNEAMLAGGAQSGGEVGLKLLAQFLRQKQMNKLQGEEAAATKTQGARQAAMLNSALGKPATDFQGRTITDQTGSPQGPADLSALLGQSMGIDPQDPVAGALMGAEIQKAYTPKPEPNFGFEELKDGQDFVKIRTVNGTPMPDPNSRSGYLEVSRGPRRQESVEGTPGDWGLSNSDQSKVLKEWRASTAATAKALRQGAQLKQIATTDPASLGKPGAIASFGNNMIQTAKGLGTMFGVDVDVDRDINSFSFNGFTGNMREVAVNNAQFQAGIYGIAFATAVAVQGSRPTDKDVQAFIDQIAGSSSDPVAFATTINGFMQTSVQALRDQSYLNEIPQEEMAKFDSLINPLMKPFETQFKYVAPEEADLLTPQEAAKLEEARRLKQNGGY